MSYRDYEYTSSVNQSGYGSNGGTPRDDRFYTPRALASSQHGSSSDGERDYFTPRYAHGTQSGGEDYQTPRSGRRDDGSPRYQPAMPFPYAQPNIEYARTSYYNNGRANGNTTSLRETQIDETDELESSTSFEDVENAFRLTRHGRCEELERLLDSGIPPHVRDEFGSTLLIVACQNGNKKVAKLLLQRGVDINGRNHKGNTALHYCFHCELQHLTALCDDDVSFY